jgi:hypothetical protein
MDAMTSPKFDEWLTEKRQRPIGRCSECLRETELRQREPAPLCGACLEKVRRREARSSDPGATNRDVKKRERRLRAELSKLLNVADALEGLINPEDHRELERIAKHYLKALIDPGSHGHEDDAQDRDQHPPTERPAEAAP